jgi:hypothetical protein
MSRILINVDDKFLDEVIALAYCGMSPAKIADYYGMTLKEWQALVRRTPSVDSKIREGKAKGEAFVLGKLMDLIKDRNIAAIKLYLEMIAKLNCDSNVIDAAPVASTPVLGTKDPIEASRRYHQIMQLKSRS